MRRPISCVAIYATSIVQNTRFYFFKLCFTSISCMPIINVLWCIMTKHDVVANAKITTMPMACQSSISFFLFFFCKARNQSCFCVSKWWKCLYHRGNLLCSEQVFHVRILCVWRWHINNELKLGLNARKHHAWPHDNDN